MRQIMKSILTLTVLIFIANLVTIDCRRGRKTKYRRLRPIKSESRRMFNSSVHCGVSRNEAIDALQELFLVGDRDMLLPENHCDILDHCDNIVDKATKKIEHSKCLQHTSAKKVFESLADGYVKVNQQRCLNKQWRKKFLRFSKCVRTSTAAADIHQCGYRLHDAFQYTLDNFNVDHQLQFTCCASQFMDACIHAKIADDCGEDIAEFAPQLFWEPLHSTFALTCPGIKSMQQCNKIYGKHMQAVEAIFRSSKKLSHRNYLELTYEIHINRGNRLPEFVPVYESNQLD